MVTILPRYTDDYADARAQVIECRRLMLTYRARLARAERKAEKAHADAGRVLDARRAGMSDAEIVSSMDSFGHAMARARAWDAVADNARREFMTYRRLLEVARREMADILRRSQNAAR